MENKISNDTNSAEAIAPKPNVENQTAPTAPEIAKPTTASQSVNAKAFGIKDNASKQSAEKNKTKAEMSETEKNVEGKKTIPAKSAKAETSKKEHKAEEPKKADRAPRLPKGFSPEKKDNSDKNGKSPPTPATPENVAPQPESPRDANRINETETIVYIDHADLHPFKNHPFHVRNDDEMKSLVASIKERGVDQAAIVRPRDGGGYELIAGHRRQAASEMAGIKNVPCVVRSMTDEEAILTMTDSNFNQRTEILPSERAQALKMQLDAIKRQGERFKGVAIGDIGKRSNEIVAEKNKMGVKTLQRYIALNNLTPDMMKLVDDKTVKSFMVAFELSYIKPKNQNYIAMTIEAQEQAPTHAQAQRMRELDAKGMLNGDIIDGIMTEQQKEEIKVIITGQELSKYFSADKTPREMKDTILKLLDEYKAKQPPELASPERNAKPPER